MNRVYFDHAATTRTDPRVLEAMLPFLSETFGNPSSVHDVGQEARAAVEAARKRVAGFIGARPDEIVFTSSGTEADNFAIKGLAAAAQKKGNHIITSSVEHHAVLHSCKKLEKQGFQVTYLPADGYGMVNPEDVAKAILPSTILISVMHANNEVGTIQPIAEISRIARERGIVFHTDAVATVGSIPVDVNRLGVDLLSLAGHQFYGPKGIGALYVRKGTTLQSIIQGGGHEHGLRSGTENIPGIIGLGRAADLAREIMAPEAERLTELRDRLAKRVMAEVKDCWINGSMEKRLPGSLNFGFRYVEGESLLLFLDSMGIAVSTGSACSSHKLEPSHVLLALGLGPEECHGSLRITMGRSNTEEEADFVADAIAKAVQRFRGISALGR